jgi:hypothetical protein
MSVALPRECDRRCRKSSVLSGTVHLVAWLRRLPLPDAASAGRKEAVTSNLALGADLELADVAADGSQPLGPEVDMGLSIPSLPLRPDRACAVSTYLDQVEMLGIDGETGRGTGR